jgi:ATP-dependent Clp protease ATP-binding subunit ClpB
MAAEGDYDKMKSAVMEIVGAHFRPEFINRIDDSVVFRPLDQAAIRNVAKIQLHHLFNRLAERDIQLDVSDAALDLLSESGYDPVFGARPLKRAIQNSIENPLAQEILSSHFLPGDKIRVDVDNGQFSFLPLMEAVAN